MFRKCKDGLIKYFDQKKFLIILQYNLEKVVQFLSLVL